MLFLYGRLYEINFVINSPLIFIILSRGLLVQSVGGPDTDTLIRNHEKNLDFILFLCYNYIIIESIISGGVKMANLNTYESKILNAIKELPDDKIQEIIDYAEFLKWKLSGLPDSKEEKRFSALMRRTRKKAEEQGFTRKDVERIIAEVRAESD